VNLANVAHCLYILYASCCGDCVVGLKCRSNIHELCHPFYVPLHHTTSRILPHNCNNGWVGAWVGIAMAPSGDGQVNINWKSMESHRMSTEK